MDIRCINWFENKASPKYLYLKAINRESKVIFLKFDYYYYYVYDADRELDFVPVDVTDLGEFKVTCIDEHISFDVDELVEHRVESKRLKLVKDTKNTRQKQYLAEYLDITWFYLLNSIVPDGCYEIDVEQLVLVSKDCYYCKCPKKTFLRKLPIFDIVYTYLFFDIECQFDKKFPSVFINPISHISCCIVDTVKEYRFTLVNSDLIPGREPDISSASEFSPHQRLVFCSETVLLYVMKDILEHRFDFVGTFNGNNFDIRYISGRLEILEKAHIYFSLPDKTETVKLRILERFQTGGAFTNKTYHINNNNGTIFFDLYSFIQKTERLDSYKLDNISKNIFDCNVVVRSTDHEGVLTISASADNNSKDKLSIFSTVLSTGNYITIGTSDIAEIVRKEISDNGFVIDARANDTYEVGSVHRICFGKDDVDLRAMYKNYDLNTALKMELYCIHDACLCKYIWDYYRITSKINAASATYLLPQSLALEYRASTLIKGPLLKLLLEEKVTYLRGETKTKYPYIGGKVFLPSQKIFDKNVMVFDYNSLYPNVCIYANLSPEKLVCVLVNGNKLEFEMNLRTVKTKYSYPDYVYVVCESRLAGYYNEISVYDRRSEGIIPKLLNMFLSKRKMYKSLLKSSTNVIETTLYDSLQYIYKIIANSVYGLMGFSNSTLYSYSSAKCCTTIGRNMITYLDSVLNGALWRGEELVLGDYPRNIFSGDILYPREMRVPYFDEQFRFRSVYGDTDSVFLEISSRDVDATITVAKELERIINTRVLHGNFRIEFEAVYTNLILQSKKKYTTIKYPADHKRGDTPIRINKGTSETRRDVAPFHKQMIQKYKDLLIQYLTESKTQQELTRTILRTLELDLLSEFNTNDNFEKYLLSRKHHNNYKSATHANFELIRKYNMENVEKIEIGERYYYLYICRACMPWQKKLCNIQSHEIVVDSNFSLPKDSRIFYEVYFRRIASEVVNLLSDKIQCTMFFTRLFGIRPIFRSD